MYYIMQCSKDLPTLNTLDSSVRIECLPKLVAVKEDYNDVKRFIEEQGEVVSSHSHWMIIEGNEHDLIVDVKILDKSTRKLRDYTEPTQ